MGIPFELKLGVDGDLIMQNGDFILTTKKSEIVVQRLGITLKTFQGEWFLDRSFGVPYLQQIVGVARKSEVVNRIILSQIASDPDVESITSYNSTFERYDRVYTLTANIVIDEENVQFLYSVDPSDEWIYPIPDPDNPRIKCEKYIIEPFAERLYYFINREGLPNHTYATWINQWVTT